MEPPYGTAEAKAWEHRRRSLMASETEKVRREMEEEDRQAQAAAELSDATGSESSDSDRDTYFNPDSSQALPVDPEWSRSQALFEDAVGDGTYFADPNCEWEEEVEECWRLSRAPGVPSRICQNPGPGPRAGECGAACSSRKKPLDWQSSCHLIYSLARPPPCAAAPCSPAYCVFLRHCGPKNL